MLGDPAGDAFAEPDHQLLGGLVDVLADLALHGDRDQVLALEPVDPDVVIVDQLTQLRGNRQADLADARQPREADAELLDRLELGRPGRHFLEVLGVLDGHRRLGRERGHRLELVLAPGMGRVVVDVQQAEQFRPVEQRRSADRVEPFLDDGGPNVQSARVVAVASGEQRPAGGDGHGRERPGRELADRLEVRLGEAACHFGDRAAVGVPEEDGAAVAIEEDHRMVDEPGQDLVEVEPAADVARDATKGVGPMEVVGDLVGGSAGTDDRADGQGDGTQEIGVNGGGIGAFAIGDQQHAPG